MRGIAWLLWLAIFMALCYLPPIAPQFHDLPEDVQARLAAVLNAVATGLAFLTSWANSHEPWGIVAMQVAPGVIALLRGSGVVRAIVAISMQFSGFALVSLGFFGAGIFGIGTAWYLALAGRRRPAAAVA